MGDWCRSFLTLVAMLRRRAKAGLELAELGSERPDFDDGHLRLKSGLRRARANRCSLVVRTVS